MSGKADVSRDKHSPMPYRDKKNFGPSQGEIATAKGPFGLVVILIVLAIVVAAKLAALIFS